MVVSEKYTTTIFRVKNQTLVSCYPNAEAVYRSNFSTLKMEAIRSSETYILTRPNRRHIPQDSILHSHSIDNLQSYIALSGWAL
jgi:hypothetical protein